MPISRLYNNAADAGTATEGLRRAGFRNEMVHSFSRADGATTASLVRRGVSPARAGRYLQRIEAGATLVIVQAPFGAAATANQILGRAGGTDVSEPSSTYEGTGLDDATPLSSAMGWPVLSHNPAPLSRLFGLPTLSRSREPKRTSFGLSLLSSNPAPLSSMLGLKLISNAAAPLSSTIGLKTLSHTAAPLSSMLGLNVLSHAAGPLSAESGVHSMSSNPAPLSRALGIPVLAEDSEHHRRP